LIEEGFPTFQYLSFDGSSLSMQKVENFFNKYNFVVVVLYPKNQKGKQPYRQCRKFKSLEGFLEKNQPLDRFNVMLGEQKTTQYGGTLISSERGVLCELAKGRQDILAHGQAPEIWRASSKWGMSPHFSENSVPETKKLIVKAMNYVRHGRDYLEGYWEFFCCDKNIYFVDYKKSEGFRKKISELF